MTECNCRPNAATKRDRVFPVIAVSAAVVAAGISFALKSACNSRRRAHRKAAPPTSTTSTDSASLLHEQVCLKREGTGTSWAIQVYQPWSLPCLSSAVTKLSERAHLPALHSPKAHEKDVRGDVDGSDTRDSDTHTSAKCLSALARSTAASSMGDVHGESLVFCPPEQTLTFDAEPRPEDDVLLELSGHEVPEPFNISDGNDMLVIPTTPDSLTAPPQRCFPTPRSSSALNVLLRTAESWASLDMFGPVGSLTADVQTSIAGTSTVLAEAQELVCSPDSRICLGSSISRTSTIDGCSSDFNSCRSQRGDTSDGSCLELLFHEPFEGPDVNVTVTMGNPLYAKAVAAASSSGAATADAHVDGEYGTAAVQTAEGPQRCESARRRLSYMTSVDNPCFAAANTCVHNPCFASHELEGAVPALMPWPRVADATRAEGPGSRVPVGDAAAALWHACNPLALAAAASATEGAPGKVLASAVLAAGGAGLVAVGAASDPKPPETPAKPRPPPFNAAASAPGSPTSALRLLSPPSLAVRTPLSCDVQASAAVTLDDNGSATSAVTATAAVFGVSDETAACQGLVKSECASDQLHILIPPAVQLPCSSKAPAVAATACSAGTGGRPTWRPTTCSSACSRGAATTADTNGRASSVNPAIPEAAAAGVDSGKLAVACQTGRTAALLGAAAAVASSAVQHSAGPSLQSSQATGQRPRPPFRPASKCIGGFQSSARVGGEAAVPSTRGSVTRISAEWPPGLPGFMRPTQASLAAATSVSGSEAGSCFGSRVGFGGAGGVGLHKPGKQGTTGLAFTRPRWR